MKWTIPIAILLLATACKNKEKIVEAKPIVSPVVEAPQIVDIDEEEVEEVEEMMDSLEEQLQFGEVETVMGFNMDSTGVPYDVLNISARGSKVNVTVQYGGGCEEHTFSLIHNGIMLESEPPQLHTVLVHDSPDDYCRAMPVENWSFDVSELGKYTQGKIILFVFDGSESHRFELDLKEGQPQIKAD